jgi:hypothetical protein
MKSNREDLQVLSVGSVVRGSDKISLPGTNIENSYARRTSLPRGQQKTIDLQFFVPSTAASKDEDYLSPVQNVGFRTELLSWPLQTPLIATPPPNNTRQLLEHEFQLVVLSPNANSYSFLSGSDAVAWQADSLIMSDERTRSYYVTTIRPNDSNGYLFPHSLITMTSIAAIVWDDVAPETLSDEQQKSLVDWVHWGGQLIVSGPSSWSRLKNSFLSPYLPASSAGASELSTDDFAAISQKWTVPDRSTNDELGFEVIGPAIAGLDMQLSENGQWLPSTGKMVAEAAVGRGRIVVTAFPMREPRIYNWKYFSNFLSTGLLRRAPREVARRTADRMLQQRFEAPFVGAERKAQMHSSLRILSRDLPSAYADEASEARELNLVGDTPAHEAASWAGGAAWNDYSALSVRAVETLRAAAGIELPSKRTILMLLGGYLLFLVPLNWLIFRIIGRLELAWVVAPLLAITGMIVVTRVARLDIGFARRTTEIGLLELHEGYDRAHLTQFIALYTSLSTNYAVELPENGSVALPLADASRQQRRAGSSSRQIQTNYGRSEGVTIEPLTVYSNSTEMLHSEQMVDLDGGLQLGKRESGDFAVKNATGIDLRSTLVLYRDENGDVYHAFLGDLNSGTTATLQYQLMRYSEAFKPWSESPITQPLYPSEGELDGEDVNLWVGGILHEVAKKTPLAKGQARLFGYTDRRTGELSLVPEQDQFDSRSVVVAHLSPQRYGMPSNDSSIMSKSVGDFSVEVAAPSPE